MGNDPCDPGNALRSPSLRGRRIAILPLGSIEWHCGAPLGTDSLLALRVAQELCRSVNSVCGGAALLPPLYYGASSEWGGYEEVSIPRDAIPLIIEGVAASLERLGYHTLVLVNAHGGNTAALRYAVERLVFDRGSRLRFYIVEWWRLVDARLGHMDALEAGLVAEALGFRAGVLCECRGLSNPYTHVECEKVEGEPVAGLWDRLVERLREAGEKICRGEGL